MVADATPRRKVFFTASCVAESSKNTKWILCKVKLSNVTNEVATRENVALSSAP
jgi:hypothetical protein